MSELGSSTPGISMGGYIIVGPDGAGEKQMILDSIMLKLTENDKKTRVRLYRFIPPSVSLGYHQKKIDIDESICKNRGYDIVRRPTGGRAVLHKGDLVYSISIAAENVKEDGPLHRGVYNLVSLAIIQGLQNIGINAEGSQELNLSLVEKKSELPRLCFSSATRHEVQIDGRKLVGSAQRRGNNALLQHGSILVTDEHLDIVNILKDVNPGRREAVRKVMISRTVSLSDHWTDISWEKLISSLKQSFSQIFDLTALNESETFFNNISEDVTALES